MDRNVIQYNAGLRSVAKLCLNLLWRQFGQRENLTKTEMLTKPVRLTELLTSPEGERDINEILQVNDETLYVNWCYKSEALLPLPTTSVMLAAFTTAQARFVPFRYLNPLKTRQNLAEISRNELCYPLHNQKKKYRCFFFCRLQLFITNYLNK